MSDDKDASIDTEYILNVIDKVLVSFENAIKDYHKVTNERIESLEKQLATLIIGYGEQAVFMEALIGQMSFATEDAQKFFHETLKNARTSMLEVMKNGARDILAPSSPVAGEAVINLASKKLSDISE
jgi:polyhydroxyalkanoate synthesis regulator phasin